MNQKRSKVCQKFASFFISLLTVDKFHVLLSFATYLIRFNTVRPWDKVLLQLHESIIIFHIKHIRRISLGCLTMLVRLICVYLRKRIVKVGHGPIAVMRSITATRHVAQAAYRKLSIFREFRCATSLFTSYDICMTAGSQGRRTLKKSEGLKTIYYT